MKLLTLTFAAVLGLCASDDIRALFYRSVDSSYFGQCIRLTNATHQIGCSGSSTNTRGVLYYANDFENITNLEQNAPHAPYIVMMESELFTGNPDTVRKLKGMESVKGIIVRYNINDTSKSDIFLDNFSPVKKCPNENGCEEDSWNEYGTDLLFTDFGDFPIFLLESEQFDEALVCYNQYNMKLSGGYGDFPLCSVELTADMNVAVDTPTCFRRGNLPIPYLNGQRFCDPLGDQNIWGTLTNLSVQDTHYDEVIMLATKLDSISFFPNSVSYGASSEIPAIATLLAIVEQLGAIQRNENVNMTRPILYTFFQGESWDYIGSSRMAYDMVNDARFPENEKLQRIFLGNVSHYIELGQLGSLSEGKVYVHGNKSSDLIQYLSTVGNVTVLNSSRQDLPPASLKSFIKEKLNFTGSVITSFNNKFDNRFFGSRFDDINNFNKSISEVAAELSILATAIARAVFNFSKPTCLEDSCASIEDTISVNSSLIADLLTCFLVNSSCDLFRSVVVPNHILPRGPMSRYVTTQNLLNPESSVTGQLLAYFTAYNTSQLNNPVKCTDCLKRMFNHSKMEDKAVNITWIPSPNESEDSDGNPLCLCIQSFTYTHNAISPVFKYKLGYDNTKYSTWTESRWSSTNVRFYLITYPLQEVGFLCLGLLLTAVTLAVSIQCTRKGDSIFEVRHSYGFVTT